MMLARLAIRSLMSMRGIACGLGVAIGLGASFHLSAAVQNLDVFARSGVQGTAITGYVAIFSTSEPNPAIGSLSAIIDWGDSAVTPATIEDSGIPGVFAVSGTHTYVGASVYTIGVTVLDLNDDDTASGSNNATIEAAPLTVTGIYFPTTLNVFFNEPIATFVDENPYVTLADLAATIDWGDGSAEATPSAITQIGSSNSYMVVGGHTYTAPGLKVVVVVVADNNNDNIALGTSYTGDRVFADGFER